MLTCAHTAVGDVTDTAGLHRNNINVRCKTFYNFSHCGWAIIEDKVTDRSLTAAVSGRRKSLTAPVRQGLYASFAAGTASPHQLFCRLAADAASRTRV
jgi:hypothetical protein